ncbi:retrotransposon gag domain, retroviral aspartyl protease [Tanacetum coccineum]
MVQTRNSDNNNPPDPIATQLAAIAAKLEAIETMKEDIAALKEGERSRSRGSKNFEGESSWRGRQQYRPYKYNKIDFPIFSGGDPRGWLLKTKNTLGECFKCGDKYELGHLCKIGTLKVLEANEDVEDPLTTNLTDLESDREETAEINLHAILGNRHPTTMKVHGMLHSTEVLILIDGGSTYNFISNVLMNELKLATQLLAPFGVQIGSGDVIRYGQIFKNLFVQINDLKITQYFHLFSLGGVDLFLGIQWLATLNTVQANWKELFIIFSVDTKRYKLEGIVTDPQKSSSFQHLAVEPEVIPCIPAPLQPISHNTPLSLRNLNIYPLLDHKPIQFHFCQTPPHLISVLTATPTPKK